MLSLTKTNSLRPTLYKLLLASLCITIIVVFSERESLKTPLTHMDGAFQTASGLFRLQRGDIPGRDFFPYLGSGVLYLLYPVFALKGGTLGTTVFSAYLMCGLTFFVSAFLNAQLINKAKLRYFSLSIAALTLCYAYATYPHISEFINRINPGNSLRPLRSFLPYLCAGLAYLTLRSTWSHRRKAYVLAVIAGAALLWFSEYAVPSCVFMGLFGLGYLYATKNLTCRTVAAYSAIACGTTALGLVLITQGYGLNLLHYYFVDAARDQYWYFAPWLSEHRIFSFEDIITKLLLPIVGWHNLTLMVVLAFWYRQPSIEYALLLFVGASLLAAGILVSVAGHIERGYTLAYVFWSKLTLTTMLLHSVLRAPEAISLSPLKHWPFCKLTTQILEHSVFLRCIKSAMLIIVMSLCGYCVTKLELSYDKLSQSLNSSSEWSYNAVLGGYVPKDVQPYLDRAAAHGNHQVIEEYWGLWSAVTRKPSPYYTDSVISALGIERERFEKTFQQNLPDYVITSTTRTAEQWQGWNLSANWWFYSIILQNYRPERASLTTHIWHKQSHLPLWPKASCTINSDGQNPSFSLGNNPIGYYEITLSYDASQLRPRTLILAKNNINYAVFAEGYLSLNPAREHSIFPVALLDTKKANFDIKLLGTDDVPSGLKLISCSARKIMFSHPDILPPIVESDATPRNLTDATWLNGVARDWSGIIVRNSEQAREKFLPGKKVGFWDGYLIKTIEHVEADGSSLRVFFSKDKLSAGMGFPREFKVFE